VMFQRCSEEQLKNVRFPLELIHFYLGKWYSDSSNLTDMRGQSRRRCKWEAGD
jgi:hypothetical protein